MKRCHKRGWRTEIDAKLALFSAQSRREHNAKRQEQSYYECPRCKKWHLTSQTGRPNHGNNAAVTLQSR